MIIERERYNDNYIDVNELIKDYNSIKAQLKKISC